MMNKKICMLVMNPCVHDSRVIKEAETLARAGYTIRVICLKRPDLNQNEIINGVEYYRVNYRLFGREFKFKNPYFKNKTISSKSAQKTFSLYNMLRPIINSFIRPFFKYYLTYETVKKAVVEYQPDIIHAHDLTTLPAAVKLSKIINAKVVYDAHELEEHRMNTPSLYVKKHIRHIQKKYLSYPVKIITVSESIAKYMADHENLQMPTVVYNSPDFSLYNAPASDVRTDLKIDKNTPLALYVGAMQKGRGVEQLLTALSHLPQFHLAVVGPKDEAYYRLATEMNLTDRIHFLGSVPVQHVVPYIATADLGVYVMQNTCLNHYYAMPNKIFEMALAGLPIVGPQLLEISHFIQKTNIGMTVDETNPLAIAKAMQDVYNNLSVFRPSLDKLNQLIAEYGWQAQAQKLLKLYQEI